VEELLAGMEFELVEYEPLAEAGAVLAVVDVVSL